MRMKAIYLTFPPGTEHCPEHGRASQSRVVCTKCFHPPQSVLRSAAWPAIQPGRLIRRLRSRPRCSSVRTEMTPFQGILEHFFAQLCCSGPCCVCLPLAATVSPLLSCRNIEECSCVSRVSPMSSTRQVRHLLILLIPLGDELHETSREPSYHRQMV